MSIYDQPITSTITDDGAKEQMTTNKTIFKRPVREGYSFLNRTDYQQRVEAKDMAVPNPVPNPVYEIMNRIDPREVVDDVGNTVAHISALLGVEYEDEEIQMLRNNVGNTVACNMAHAGNGSKITDYALGHTLTVTNDGFLKSLLNRDLSYDMLNARPRSHYREVTYANILVGLGKRYSDEVLLSGKLHDAADIAIRMANDGHMFTNENILRMEGHCNWIRETISVFDVQVHRAFQDPNDSNQSYRNMENPKVEDAVIRSFVWAEYGYGIHNRYLYSRRFPNGKLGIELQLEGVITRDALSYKPYGPKAMFFRPFLAKTAIEIDVDTLDFDLSKYPFFAAKLLEDGYTFKREQSLFAAIGSLHSFGTNFIYGETPDSYQANKELFTKFVNSKLVVGDDCKLLPNGFTIAHGKAFYRMPVDPIHACIATDDGTTVAHIMALRGNFIGDLEIMLLKNNAGRSVASYYGDFLMRQAFQPVERMVKWTQKVIDMHMSMFRRLSNEESESTDMLRGWWIRMSDVVGYDKRIFPPLTPLIVNNHPVFTLELYNQIMEMGEAERMQFLKQVVHGGDVYDDGDYTVAHLLARSPRVCMEIVNNREILTIADKNGWTVAHTVASRCEGLPLDDVELLSMRDKYDHTVAHELMNCYPMLAAELDVKTLSIRDSQGYTPAHIAAKGYMFSDGEILQLKCDHWRGRHTGETVAMRMIGNGWTTNDPNIYRMSGGDNMSLIEGMALKIMHDSIYDKRGVHPRVSTY